MRASPMTTTPSLSAVVSLSRGPRPHSVATAVLRGPTRHYSSSSSSCGLATADQHDPTGRVPSSSSRTSSSGSFLRPRSLAPSSPNPLPGKNVGVHALTGAELGHAVRAAAAKGHLQNQPRVFAELKQRALYLLPTLQPKTRVFVFAGFAKCLEASTQSSFSTEAAAAVLDRVMEEFVGEQCRGCDAQDAALLLNALAKVVGANLDDRRTGAAGAAGTATRGRGEQASRLVESLCRNVLADDEAFVGKATEQHLALTIHALGRLGVRDEGLIVKKLCPAVVWRINEFGPQGVSNVLHGMAKLEFFPNSKRPLAPILEKTYAALLTRLAFFEPDKILSQHVANCLDAMAKLGLVLATASKDPAVGTPASTAASAAATKALAHLRDKCVPEKAVSFSPKEVAASLSALVRFPHRNLQEAAIEVLTTRCAQSLNVYQWQELGTVLNALSLASSHEVNFINVAATARWKLYNHCDQDRQLLNQLKSATKRGLFEKSQAHLQLYLAKKLPHRNNGVGLGLIFAALARQVHFDDKTRLNLPFLELLADRLVGHFGADVLVSGQAAAHQNRDFRGAYSEQTLVNVLYAIQRFADRVPPEIVGAEDAAPEAEPGEGKSHQEVMRGQHQVDQQERVIGSLRVPAFARRLFAAVRSLILASRPLEEVEVDSQHLVNSVYAFGRLGDPQSVLLLGKSLLSPAVLNCLTPQQAGNALHALGTVSVVPEEQLRAAEQHSQCCTSHARQIALAVARAAVFPKEKLPNFSAQMLVSALESLASLGADFLLSPQQGNKEQEQQLVKRLSLHIRLAAEGEQHVDVRVLAVALAKLRLFDADLFAYCLMRASGILNLSNCGSLRASREELRDQARRGVETQLAVLDAVAVALEAGAHSCEVVASKRSLGGGCGSALGQPLLARTSTAASASLARESQLCSRVRGAVKVLEASLLRNVQVVQTPGRGGLYPQSSSCYLYSDAGIHFPTTVADLRRFAGICGRLRAVGVGEGASPFGFLDQLLRLPGGGFPVPSTPQVPNTLEESLPSCVAAVASPDEQASEPAFEVLLRLCGCVTASSGAGLVAEALRLIGDAHQPRAEGILVPTIPRSVLDHFVAKISSSFDAFRTADQVAAVLAAIPINGKSQKKLAPYVPPRSLLKKVFAFATEEGFDTELESLRQLVEARKTQATSAVLIAGFFKWSAPVQGLTKQVEQVPRPELSGFNREAFTENLAKAAGENVRFNFQLLPEVLPWLLESRVGGWTSSSSSKTVLNNRTLRKSTNPAPAQVAAKLVDAAVALQVGFGRGCGQGQDEPPKLDELEFGVDYYLRVLAELPPELPIQRRVVEKVCSLQHTSRAEAGPTAGTSLETMRRALVTCHFSDQVDGQDLEARFFRVLLDRLLASSWTPRNKSTTSEMLSFVLAFAQRICSSRESSSQTERSQLLLQLKQLVRTSFKGGGGAGFGRSCTNVEVRDLDADDKLKLALFCITTEYLDDGILQNCVRAFLPTSSPNSSSSTASSLLLGETQRRALGHVLGVLRAEHPGWYSREIEPVGERGVC